MAGLRRYRSQIILLLDTLTIWGCATLFYILAIPEASLTDYFSNFFFNTLVLMSLSVVFQLIFHTYNSLWRYAETQEYFTLCISQIFNAMTFVLIDTFFLRHYNKEMNIFNIILVCFASLIAMLLYRFLYRVYRTKAIQRKANTAVNKRINVAVVGGGESGRMVIHEMQVNPASIFNPCMIFDDDKNKVGGCIYGVPVKGTIENAIPVMQAANVKDIILAIPSLSSDKIGEIAMHFAGSGMRVKIADEFLDNISSSKERAAIKVRNIQISDLLKRDTVSFDARIVSDFVSGKTVMVTGGGGSIGSELCRQLSKFDVKKLVIVDIYENNAYDIQQELLRNCPELNLSAEIASVRDSAKLDVIFDRYKPDVVFHAAAHKHVPLMEDAPEEAIKNNVFGTYNCALAASKHGAEKFILISTDKAVNPTNVMGASKRLCEMVLQSMNGVSKTVYSAVRFGNVLGSNGSVIPLFKRQIEEGGPVTLTDKRIIRYFMTIPEAAQLVLQAGSMAKRSEIFVLNMGNPVKIYDLAKKMIVLAGYTPYVDINIVEIGLRPGEKLYEELLMRSETLTKTDNNKIFIEKQEKIAPEELREKLTILSEALKSNDVETIRAAMKRVVPTYHSPEEVNAKAFNLDYSNVGNKKEPVNI